MQNIQSFFPHPGCVQIGVRPNELTEHWVVGQVEELAKKEIKRYINLF